MLECDNNMRLGPLDPLVGNHIERVATALFEATTDDPNDDGQLLLNGLPRAPDVEVQTVLALGVPILELGYELPEDARLIAAVLETDGLVCLRVCGTHVGRLLGRHEAPGPQGWPGVRNAKPLVHIWGGSIDHTREGAAAGLDGEAMLVSIAARTGGCVLCTRQRRQQERRNGEAAEPHINNDVADGGAPSVSDAC